jgi:hypothetical protein
MRANHGEGRSQVPPHQDSSTLSELMGALGIPQFLFLNHIIGLGIYNIHGDTG